jgi:hypothetical protein
LFVSSDAHPDRRPIPARKGRHPPEYPSQRKTNSGTNTGIACMPAIRGTPLALAEQDGNGAIKLKRREQP